MSDEFFGLQRKTEFNFLSPEEAINVAEGKSYMYASSEKRKVPSFIFESKIVQDRSREIDGEYYAQVFPEDFDMLTGEEAVDLKKLTKYNLSENYKTYIKFRYALRNNNLNFTKERDTKNIIYYLLYRFNKFVNLEEILSFQDTYKESLMNYLIYPNKISKSGKQLKSVIFPEIDCYITGPGVIQSLLGEDITEEIIESCDESADNLVRIYSDKALIKGSLALSLLSGFDFV